MTWYTDGQRIPFGKYSAKCTANHMSDFETMFLGCRCLEGSYGGPGMVSQNQIHDRVIQRVVQGFYD